MGGGNTPSGDITIDDVVKFIHDNWNSSDINFPYTTWDSIPNVDDVSVDEIFKSRFYTDTNGFPILMIENGEEPYIIGFKGQSPE